ncbi:hypothetical protein EYF80_036060 [Liparis tanakae]|uniref:Uncharacterized protein n=1 Tax=Liparis tanakae TaxID=230148 RepID=A0A4Z2GKL4_9TELE|nr:hypothetical protein EYF80_036060 [Liparis tanakae]
MLLAIAVGLLPVQVGFIRSNPESESECAHSDPNEHRRLEERQRPLVALSDMTGKEPPRLGEARPLVRLPGELKLRPLADHHLRRGEHLQASEHVTADRPALAVRQAHVDVSFPVQGPDQGYDLEPPSEAERCLGDAAHAGDDERRSQPPLLHEGLQRAHQLLTRAEPDRMDPQGRAASC